jgi:SlyX protein
MEKRLETLETQLAFQDDIIQKLDDALASQQKQLLDMQRQIELLMDQIKLMEKIGPDTPEGPEAPPPHY